MLPTRIFPNLLDPGQSPACGYDIIYLDDHDFPCPPINQLR